MAFYAKSPRGQLVPAYITDTRGREVFCARRYGWRANMPEPKKQWERLQEKKLERSFLRRQWEIRPLRRIPIFGSY